MYNHDVLGTRPQPGRDGHRPGQRRPARGEVAVPRQGLGPGDRGHPRHAVVVGGYVYFGTATDPTFYKLTPDGKVRWSYRNPTRGGEGRPARPTAAPQEPAHDSGFQSAPRGS